MIFDNRRFVRAYVGVDQIAGNPLFWIVHGWYVACNCVDECNALQKCNAPTAEGHDPLKNMIISGTIVWKELGAYGADWLKCYKCANFV